LGTVKGFELSPLSRLDTEYGLVCPALERDWLQHGARYTEILSYPMLDINNYSI
jgi:hypothetical protein